MKKLLIKLRACEDARGWAGEKSIKEIVEQCHRGEWLLWLAKKVDIGLQPLTLAKGHCANTVRHLMKDERSIKAVDIAISFGEGKASKEDLDAASDAAYAAAYAAADDAAYAAAASASDAAYAAYDAYAAAAAAYSAAYAAADAAAYAADAAARTQNQKQTADICRQFIGQLIIDKCNELIQGGNNEQRETK